MKESVLKATAIINEKTLRERAILMAVAVALVYFVVDFILLGGLLDNNNNLQSKLQGLASANASSAQQAEHQSVIADAQLQRQKLDRDAMLLRLERVDEELLSVTNGFVPAKLMPVVLEEMLLSHKGLKLLALENMPAKSILTDAKNKTKSKTKSENKKNDDAAQLYRHGVKLQLQGSYGHVLAYLQNLESLKWHFQWDKLVYQIDEYPKGKLIIEVFTYSSDKEWLGV